MKNSQHTKKVNLGSGKDHFKGFVNVDNNPDNKPDMLHDLNNFPYPFKKGEVDYVRMHHVLEHLDSPLKVMEELARITRKEAVIDIEVPYGTTTNRNPWHKHDFVPAWFEFLCQGKWTHIRRLPFKIKRMNVIRGKHAFWRKYEIHVKLIRLQ